MDCKQIAYTERPLYHGWTLSCLFFSRSAPHDRKPQLGPGRHPVIGIAQGLAWCIKYLGKSRCAILGIA